MMTHQEKITQAKAKLMLENPYFGTIASGFELIENDEILTFTNDGACMRYNAEYIDKLSVSDVEFVMANGAMHSVLKHQERNNQRTGWLWQRATDYVVNAMLVKNGMQAPLYANYEEKFEGMYAEEVYEHLHAEMMDNSQESREEEQELSQSDDELQDNIHLQRENIASEDALEKQIKNDTNAQEDLEELKEHLEQTFEKLKAQGSLPKDLEFVVPEYFSHQVDWREVLYGYIASYAKSTYSFNPPNMKYLYRGICLPSLDSDLLSVVVAVDTSGSVDEELLKIFLAEISSIMQQYPNYEINLITADAKIQSHRVFLAGESLDYELSGGGGTDFRPVFTFVDEEINYPRLLLYFTDGEGRYPQEEPFYDVLWIMPKTKEVPFGELLEIDIN